MRIRGPAAISSKCSAWPARSGDLANDVDGIMHLPTGTVHLIVGSNADQYAAEMHGQVAGAVRQNGAVAAAPAGGR